MSTHEESARVAGTCLAAFVLLLGLAACRQGVDPSASPEPADVTWADGSDYEPGCACGAPPSAGRVLVGEPLDLTGSGPLNLVSSGSLALSTSAPSRLVFTDGPDHRTTWAMRLDRDRQEVVIEDGAGRELARGVEVGERTDGFLVLRDRRGWEVWRSTDPCPPVWSRLPR